MCLGQRHLGAAIGTRLFTEEYVSRKVKTWSDELLTLSSIAETHPHSAYCASVHGVVPKWNYAMRIIESVGSLFQPLEDVIHAIIPYQLTKVLHMTPSELDEIWCVGSPGGHMYPKRISSKLLIWLPKNGLLNILLFVIFALPVIIQSIITWAFFIF